MRFFNYVHRRPHTINFIIPLATKDRHVGCPFCNYGGCEYEERGYLGHLSWTFHLMLSCLKTKFSLRRFKRWLTALDYSRIEDIEFDGIDHGDCPDYVDAYISSATYKGREMSECELERLNEDTYFVHEALQGYLY